MTTVTGLTADRMLAIEAASVIDGDVDGSGNLILTKHDGTQINAGSVIGPVGPQGPIGAMLSVLSAAGILDVGLSSQIRAGRQLSPADFANIGLNAPAGLWNLSDLSDASGNGRALSNKGAVPFASGINGVANSAAQFVGSTAQALYIPDTGVNDPFRIKTGSWGGWMRNAKRAVTQVLISKWSAVAGNYGWWAGVGGNNFAVLNISTTGSDVLNIIGVSDISDDRWHFIVATHDGAVLRLYVDGVLEISGLFGPIFSANGPLNVGSQAADSGSVASSPSFGRIDEAFVTADVLSEDQIRNLYCAKIAHTLAAVPVRVSLNVRRRKKGPALAVADFPTQPLRLHNFSAGSLGDQGSNNVGLTNNGTAVGVAGVDGSSGNAFSFAGAQSLSATDAGLPAGLAARSYGCWFKSTAFSSAAIIGWGSGVGTSAQALFISNSGVIISRAVGDDIVGTYVADGQWHFVVETEDNAAIDGVKRKLYVDGRLIGTSVTMANLTLAGINRFRIAAWPDGSTPFPGQIDAAFVCDYTLTADQVHALYAKGSQALSPSPKNVGDHVEGMDAANLYAIFDVLDSQNQIDLAVA